MKCRIRCSTFAQALTALVLCMPVATASAQGYNTDARKIGMGGIGGDEDIAAQMVPHDPSYTAIVLPFGLIRVVKDLHRFDPNNAQFDPVRAIEDAASPLHYTFGRSSTSAGQQMFMSDLVNGRMNRDLSTYRGFVMPASLVAEGLAAPDAGGSTLKFAKHPDGGYQGIYLGAGPYVSFNTDLSVDQKLVTVLGSATPVSFPNDAFRVTNQSAVQVALMITGGYRARVTFPGVTSARDGVYVGVNYHFLRGFKYLAPDTTVRFDTDASGLLTLQPTTVPLAITDLESSTGIGRAFDAGLEIVRNHGRMGFGANGLGNQIRWTGLVEKQFTRQSLVQNLDFVKTITAPAASSVTVTLPVVYTANVGYSAAAWDVEADVAKGFNGRSLHAGLERTMGGVALRGGGCYSRGTWNPSAGFGVGSHVALDVALYGTNANLAGTRELAMAVSIRINHK